MGSNLSRELTDGTLSELGINVTYEQAITWHLRGNFFPPVPVVMVKPCIEAIEAVNAGNHGQLIQLPINGFKANGDPLQILWKGVDQAPAWAIVEAHHLEEWLEGDDDE